MFDAEDDVFVRRLIEGNQSAAADDANLKLPETPPSPQEDS
jgi:hypothetical protein